MKNTPYALIAAIAVLVAMPLAAQSSSSTSNPTPAPAAKQTATNAKNSGHASESVEYKDPEDMTTRYRPGNNKTTKVDAPSDVKAAASATQGAGSGKDKTTVKQSGIPACDGASKDAAKCAAPNSGTQSDTRVNKVDSFTVKQ